VSRIWDFGHCDLFDICDLLFGASFTIGNQFYIRADAAYLPQAGSHKD
jgi:hypothetical protein